MKKSMQKAVMILLLALAGGALFAGCGGGDCSVVGMLSALEKQILAKTPGDNGAVLAVVEGEKLYRKMFDLQLDMVLQNTRGLSEAQQLKAKNDPDILKQYLQQMVMNKVIQMELAKDRKMLEDPEFMIFLDMTMSKAIQEYYLMKKLGSQMNTNVSDVELNQAYATLNKDPKYRARLARIPMAQIRQVLRGQILQQRQKKLLQEQMLKMQGKYRIDIRDEQLTGGAASSAAPSAGKPGTAAPATGGKGPVK